MAYADKEKQRATTRKRVKRHRAKKTGATKSSDCKVCGGKGFIELEHGLIQKKCKECQ